VNQPDLGSLLTPEVLDLRHISCGLVPAMLAHLARTESVEVDILVRPGIETEIVNGFGTSSDWELTFKPSIGQAVAHFVRQRPKQGFVPRLDLVDY